MSIESFRELVADSDNIVFFGGAGVSTESDIPDFRSSTGLYNGKNNYKYSPEQMLSHSFFLSHTDEFYDFYRNNMIYTNARPNDAHIALAKLEKAGKLKAVITQNIDGLHQMAGSTEVLELHGSIHRNYCMKCHKFYDLNSVLSTDGIPKCTCGGTIKPDVVLYEESLNTSVIDKAISYIENADVLIVGGTSLTVYPAAGLVDYYLGNKLILINQSSTPYDRGANMVIHDKIGETLKHIC